MRVLALVPALLLGVRCGCAVFPQTVGNCARMDIMRKRKCASRG